MNKKLFSFCSKFLTLLLVFSILTAALGAVCLFLTSSIGKGEAVSGAYFLMGEILIPFQLLATKTLGELSASSLQLYAILIAASLLIIGFLAIKYLAACRRQKSKYNFIWAIISCILVLAIFTISLSILFSKNLQITKFLNKVKTGIIENVPENAIIAKMFVISISSIACTLISVVMLIIFMPKTKKEVLLSGVGPSLNFYSSEYEEQAKENKTALKIKEDNARQIEGKIPEQRHAAKELVYKVMELNEMKENGEISAKEYTRLRQKAIRKYKK